MVAWLSLYLLPGCGVGVLPSAQIEGIGLTGLSASEAALDLTVGVHNPMWVDVHVDAWRWQLTVGDGRVASGQADKASILAAGARTSVTVPVVVRYSDLASAWPSTDEALAVARLSAEIDTVTPAGRVVVPLETQFEIPRFRTPSLDLLRVGWDVEDDGTLALALGAKLSLPDSVTASRVDWAVSVDARRLAAGNVAVDGAGALQVTARLDPANAASAGWDWLWGDAHRLALEVAGRVNTPLGVAPIQLDAAIPLTDYGAPPQED